MKKHCNRNFCSRVNCCWFEAVISLLLWGICIFIFSFLNSANWLSPPCVTIMRIFYRQLGTMCMFYVSVIIIIKTPALHFDSLSPETCGSNIKSLSFKLILQNSSLGAHFEISLRWMLKHLTNEKSLFVQVMTWCHQATSHYLSQPWLRSMLP